MVLERAGLLFEGHTRLSFWLDDENSDDWLYGMTRADWEAWTRPAAQPAGRGAAGRGHRPTTSAPCAVCAATSRRSGSSSPVIDSFADAMFPERIDGAPVVPWMRAIEADGSSSAS